jgi:hypothetical protein
MHSLAEVSSNIPSNIIILGMASFNPMDPEIPAKLLRACSKLPSDDP